MLGTHGAKIDALDKVHETPLGKAVNDNRPSAVEALLALGADPNIKGIGGNANLLEMARKPHHSKLLAPMLIKAGAREPDAAKS